MANFKRSNFVSSAVRNPSLQKNRTMMHLTASMGIDFTERCHVLFNPVVESLLCSAWPSCTPVQKLSARIAVLSKVSGTWTLISVALSVKVQDYPICDISMFPVWYLFQHLIFVYISDNTRRMSMKCLQNICFDESKCKIYWWNRSGNASFIQGLIQGAKGAIVRDLMLFCGQLLCCSSVVKYTSSLTVAKPKCDLTTKYYWNRPPNVTHRIWFHQLCSLKNPVWKGTLV